MGSAVERSLGESEGVVVTAVGSNVGVAVVGTGGGTEGSGGGHSGGVGMYVYGSNGLLIAWPDPPILG